VAARSLQSDLIDRESLISDLVSLFHLTFDKNETPDLVSGFGFDARFGLLQFMFLMNQICITPFEFTQIAHGSHGRSCGMRTAFELEERTMERPEMEI
jgi:hypothetical protein